MPTYTHETGWQRAVGKYMGRSMVYDDLWSRFASKDRLEYERLGYVISDELYFNETTTQVHKCFILTHDPVSDVIGTGVVL